MSNTIVYDWRHRIEGICVSVIVPAHNVAGYIGQALSSILGQTLRSIEVLVIDDASTDSTTDIVAQFVSLDRRVKLFRLQRNGGVSRARNHALSIARGRWVAFVDADDWLHPKRLATLVARADALELDWLADDQIILSDPDAPPLGRVLRHEPLGINRISAVHVVQRDPPERIGYGTLKPLVRSRFLQDTALSFRVGPERGEDFLFHLDCGLNGGRMALLNEPLYYYRRRAGSLTTSAPIPTLTGMLEQNDTATAAAQTAGNAALVRVLNRRERQIRSALASRCLLEDLRNSDIQKVATTVFKAPSTAFAFAGLVGRATLRRIRIGYQ